MSTSCTSPTAFALSLVPDLPWVVKPSPGNLGHSTAWIITTLSLLMPAFSRPYSPHPLTIVLQPVWIAPLPIDIAINPQTSVVGLAPFIFGAHSLDQ